MRTYIALLSLAFVGLGCSGDSPTDPDETPLAFETVLSSSYSGFETARREVIRSPSEWASAWQALHAGVTPGPAVPAIDFGREMAVLVAAGSRASGCYAIAVTGASRRTGEVEMQVVESVPGPTCVCTLAITRPVHVVRVERALGAESFVEGGRTIQC